MLCMSLIVWRILHKLHVKMTHFAFAQLRVPLSALLFTRYKQNRRKNMAVLLFGNFRFLKFGRLSIPYLK